MIIIAIPILSKSCNAPCSVAVSPVYGGQGETLIYTGNMTIDVFFYFNITHVLLGLVSDAV